MKPFIRLAGMLAVALGAMALATTASAAVEPLGCSNSVLFYATLDADPHPSSTRIVMQLTELPDRMLAMAPGFDFCLYYEADLGTDPGGRLSGRVRVVRQGQKIARVRVTSTAVENGVGVRCANANVDLRPGDVLVWDVRFRDFEDLEILQVFETEVVLLPGGLGDLFGSS